MNSNKSIIHFDFPIDVPILFDARPIWNVLKNAKLNKSDHEFILNNYGSTALSIVTRGSLMGAALIKLETALKELYKSPDLIQHPKFLAGPDIKHIQYDLLLYLDSLMFEFRSYLDLLATFTYHVLSPLKKIPTNGLVKLSSGENIRLLDINKKLKRNSYLLYLCDELGLSEDWYKFLNSDRNIFTHESAPYCAVEFSPGPPAEFELIIMRKNITDFQTAKPEDFFKVSELQSIIDGVVKFAPAVQAYIIIQYKQNSLSTDNKHAS